MVLWLSSVLDWRQDRLAEAESANRAFERVAAEIDEPLLALGSEVAFVQRQFAGGDWTRTFDIGAAKLDARRKTGQFLPAPMLNLTCRAGLYTDQIEAAAPYCEALAGRSDYSGGAGVRLYAAELAIGRGDVDKARAELGASRALSEGDPALEADWLRIEAAIEAKEGDLDAAEALVWRYADLVRSDPAWRSTQATMLRLFGRWAIGAGAPERACAALKESRALYDAVGAAAGAEAVDVLQLEARCP